VGEVAALCAAGEGRAAKPPTEATPPSPQPLPHQGGGAKDYAAELFNGTYLQFDIELLEVVAFLLEIRPGQRMLVHPGRGQLQLQELVVRLQFDWRRGIGGAAALQQHRQAQQGRHARRGPTQAFGQAAQEHFIGFAPVAAQDRGKHLLLEPAEAREIRVLDDIGAVQMVLAMRDSQPDFVDSRSP